MKKALVVGAGVAGCTVARVLAERGEHVTVVERRTHIGGNCYDEKNDYGITIHQYGPHIFHTNDKEVWDFLSRFTDWRLYQHRVLSFVHGMLVPMPINIDTVNTLFGLSTNSETIEEFYASRRVNIKSPANFKEAVIAQVGEELYELLFANYTKKQWGVTGDHLPAEVAGRIPTRSNRDSRYFSDQYQGIPERGFTAMFAKMLGHPKIELRLNCDYSGLAESEKAQPTYYSGSIDELFGQRFGALPYRSLRFEFKTHDKERYQPTAVVNYPNDYDFTRITEFKHFLDEESRKTTVIYEYPSDQGEPYYPVFTEEAKDRYGRYAAMAKKEYSHISLMGRLGIYKYMNIDHCVRHSLDLCRQS